MEYSVECSLPVIWHVTGIVNIAGRKNNGCSRWTPMQIDRLDSIVTTKSVKSMCDLLAS